MPAPLCPAKREVIEDALSRSVDASLISLVAGVSTQQIAKMKRNISVYGSSYKPREKASGRPKKLNEGMDKELRTFLHEHPTVYIHDVRSFLSDRFEVHLSVASISRLLKRLGHDLPPRVEVTHTRNPLSDSILTSLQRPPRPYKGYRYSRKAPAEFAIQQQMPHLKMLKLRPEYSLDSQLADKEQQGQLQSEGRTTPDHVVHRDEQFTTELRKSLEEYSKG
ncbi:MAG: hypothetical protein M1836_001331 [Candelina mexicana]|nr:MAG: hypothetical protein M1836_001331 [Candelina mexicana]